MKTEKNLATNFNACVEHADLFAEQAMVATIGFKGNNAQQLQTDFLDFLTGRKIGHQVLSREKNKITFVIAREKDLEAEFIRSQVAAFFTGERAGAKDFEGYYQKFNTEHEMQQALPSPLDAERLAVRQLVQNLCR